MDTACIASLTVYFFKKKNQTQFFPQITYNEHLAVLPSCGSFGFNEFIRSQIYSPGEFNV